jgi:hypothetical protein
MADVTRLDDDLLSDFMDKFYGYGNYSGRYWFIGMEEGGGKNAQEIQRRLNAWEKRGERELEDLREFHFAADLPANFSEPVKSQTTWNKLIRLVLSAEKQALTLDAVKRYQSEQLARTNSDTCLLELIPLPLPSTSEESRSDANWFYGKFSQLPQLRSYTTYYQRYALSRAKHLQQRIAEYKPSIVVFYGFGYLEWWQTIAVHSLRNMQSGEGRYFINEDYETSYVVVSHPAAKGVTNEYFHRIGELLST